jgi:hypothetical protein
VVSYPAEEQEDLRQWMKEWTEFLLEGDVSFGVTDAENKVVSFCISELFPSATEFVDNFPQTSK